jgi:hypothetical protein
MSILHPHLQLDIPLPSLKDNRQRRPFGDHDHEQVIGDL